MDDKSSTSSDDSSDIFSHLNPTEAEQILFLKSNVLEEKLKIANLEIVKLQENEEKFKEEIDKLKNENKYISELYNSQKEELNNINKKFDNLALNMEQFTFKRVSFIVLKNKWVNVDTDWNPCCTNKCINTKRRNGKCINRNGFIELINDLDVKYNNCVKGEGVNKKAFVYSPNKFHKPHNSFTFSLFYFEVKCQIENNFDETEMQIGVNVNNIFIRLQANESKIYYGLQSKEGKEFKIDSFTFENNDILGCGLVYPMIVLNEKLPYLFFTQNGKQIGKAVLLEQNSEVYEPFISLKCCSVETNFGNDLKDKPFSYDVSKHFLLEEFY